MMRGFFREPLLHFMVLGLVIYCAGQFWPKNSDQYRIVIDRAQVEGIRQNYVSEYGMQPSPAQLKFLVDANIRDQILYREGLARQLDRDDEIVHRRIVQKAEFLLQDMSPPPEPTSGDLRAYYSDHEQDYILPERATFTHIYFSPTAGDGKARALATLRKLRTGSRRRAPELGDIFSDQYDYTALDKTAVQRIFGKGEFSAAPFEAPIGEWVGPFQSGLGWHLLRVTAREESRKASFEEMEGTVRADWLKAAEVKANAEAFARIKAKYIVVLAGIEDGTKSKGAAVASASEKYPVRDGQN